ncbi:unnamed protein product [Rotaria sp. Silwood2]|nr:unnamed protein product [Rotaria sp. Silwood2]CAF4224368.1 unnamed protein product [Rotaria sp. Silwood2]
MANSTSSKLSMTGNVIYDSGNDRSTGKKRAVIPTGGVSVAERARLFGTQITTSSAFKNSNLSNQQEQRPPPHNNQSTKSNVKHHDRNYQSVKTNVDRRPRQDTSYSTSQRILNNRQQPVQINGKKKHEQPSTNDAHHYSTGTRTHTHSKHSSPSRRPLTTHDRYRYDTPPKRRHNIISPTKITISGESYILDGKVYNDPYLNSYDEPNVPSYYQQPSYNIPYQSSNYFQPIKDPLEELYMNSSQGYSQQQIPRKNYTNIDGIQPFELGNLIHRIQQDYMDNVRPYVSSIEYVENNQNFADIGLITPATSRKDYTRRTNDLYRRKVPSNHYDIIETNDSYPYRKRSSKYQSDDNQHSSMQRKYRRRYHDQASSPIHTVGISNKINKQHKPESPPAAVVPKAPSPKVTSSSEDEEEATTNKKPEKSKVPESETSSEEESEEESEKNTSKQPSSQLVNGTVPTSTTTGNSATQRNDITRPMLSNQTASNIAQTQAKQDETEESESEESDSDSDSDTDEDDDEEPKPSPNIGSNNLRTIPAIRTTPATSQTNARSNNLRTTPATPQKNAQLIQQREIYDNHNTNEPPESPDLGTNEFFELDDSGKSSRGSKFKSIKNLFRRHKS